jgi:hypothetical protein
MLAVVYDVVVAKAVPPTSSSYHATVPPVGAVDVNTNVPVPHLVAPVAAGANGKAFTVAVTVNLLADKHPANIFLACA